MDKINAVRLSIDGTNSSLQEFNTSWYLEPQYHFLKINLEQPMLLGLNYTLFIDYSSTMNEGPMKRGIWRGWYIDENDVER